MGMSAADCHRLASYIRCCKLNPIQTRVQNHDQINSDCVQTLLSISMFNWHGSSSQAGTEGGASGGGGIVASHIWIYCAITLNPPPPPLDSGRTRWMEGVVALTKGALTIGAYIRIPRPWAMNSNTYVCTWEEMVSETGCVQDWYIWYYEYYRREHLECMYTSSILCYPTPSS